MENQTAENMENEMALGVIHKLAPLPMYPQFSDNVFLYKRGLRSRHAENCAGPKPCTMNPGFRGLGV